MLHFRNNLSAIYVLITDEYCTKAMLSYIEQRSDFKTTICDDPLELLKAIEEGIHQPAAGQFHLETLSAAYWRWLGDRQQKQETVDEYLTRHKHFANLVEAHMCEGFMDEYQKTTPEFKKAVTQKEMDNILKKGFERWKAYVFWRGSDNDKYGELRGSFR